MGLLRSVFGPSRDEIWGRIAQEIGGDYEEGGFFQKGALRFRAGEWEITLDTYTVSSGNSSTTYTRMRAPFVNKDGFYFKIYRQGFFAAVGKTFGMQDIQVGDPLFDDHFVVQANNERKVRLLLDDAQLRRLIEAQPHISFQIRDDDGWFGKHFPEGVDELYFQCHGVLKDKRLLKSLFDMFTRTLDRLVRIDSAYEDDPHVQL